MVVQEVAPGVLVATDSSGVNVGLIRTKAGAVLIDAPLIPSQARAWRTQVENLSAEGVAYVVNTDYHFSHALGTCFLPSALTVGHETGWKHLKSLNRESAFEKLLEADQGRTPDLASQLADVRIVLPQLTVGGTITFWCDGRRVDVLYMGGHTPATLAVYLPEERVLFTGDLVVDGCHPYAGDTICLQWLDALQRVRTMDVATIVPGRGHPGGLELVDPVYDYLKDMRTRVEECYHEGHTRRETVERVKPLDAFPIPSGEEERLRRLLRSSVERVYDEIKKANTRGRKRTR